MLNTSRILSFLCLLIVYGCGSITIDTPKGATHVPGYPNTLLSVPIQIEVSDVLWIMAASLGIAMLATLWPARQASRLFPVEAIRHE